MKLMEFTHLLSKFKSIVEKKIGIYTYYEAQHKDKTIYILHSAIGIINTSISLTKFLSLIKPDIIINAGTSGAHDKKLNVGDIILAKEVINMNSIDTIFKEENEGSDSLTWKLKTFSEDAENQDFIEDIKIYYGDNNLLEKIKNIGNKYGINIYEGRIGSGDVWNKEKDRSA